MGACGRWISLMLKNNSLRAIRQFPASELRESHCDLFLVASGYEERATFVAGFLGGLRADERVALCFRDRKRELARPHNDAHFRKLGFQLVDADGSSGEELLSVVGKVIDGCGESRCHIIVDYSCMTRVWYASLVSYIFSRAQGGAVIDFLYAPAHFTPPLPTRTNRYVQALAGFSGLSSPVRPTALVVGLGYESERALGLVNYVEPAETIAFLAEPAIDPKFVEATMGANAPLIELLGIDRIVRYPFRNFQATAVLLESCCAGLVKEHRTILAPLGPKPFTLLCLLLAVRLPGVEVWRVSAGERGNVKSRKAMGEVIAIRIGGRLHHGVA